MVLALWEMQKASSIIWTRVAVSKCDETTSASQIYVN